MSQKSDSLDVTRHVSIIIDVPALFRHQALRLLVTVASYGNGDDKLSVAM
jgi:hypothetical protein